MSFNRNKNLKIVGFFGQSGAGKTTIIRNVDKKVNGKIILQNTGIIRYLFKKNNYYKNPINIINDKKRKVDVITSEKEKEAKIDEIYEKYIRSQMQLLNDWSTEVYLATKEKYAQESILLLDRSPIDFYVLTLCGLKVLIDAFGKPLNDNGEYFVRLNEQIAEDNTNNFFNAIFVTKPWSTSNINTLRDGIRDQYLTKDYTNDNWYPYYNDVKLNESIKTFIIKEEITDLYKRAKFVSEKITEI